MTDTLNHQVLKRLAINYWQQEPRNRPVKITSVSRAPTFWSEGYITCHKFIAGRSLFEAERILGLPPGALQGGAYLHEFLRMPTPDEFELRSYTHRPDGKDPIPGSSYQPGRGAAQWEVRKNTFIPSRVIALVQAGGRIP